VFDVAEMLTIVGLVGILGILGLNAERINRELKATRAQQASTASALHQVQARLKTLGSQLLGQNLALAQRQRIVFYMHTWATAVVAVDSGSAPANDACGGQKVTVGPSGPCKEALDKLIAACQALQQQIQTASVPPELKEADVEAKATVDLWLRGLSAERAAVDHNDIAALNAGIDIENDGTNNHLRQLWLLFFKALSVLPTAS
jgi:hypothetical protein